MDNPTTAPVTAPASTTAAPVSKGTLHLKNAPAASAAPSTTTTPASVPTAKEQMTEIMKSDAYRNASHADNKTANEKVEALLAQEREGEKPQAITRDRSKNLFSEDAEPQAEVATEEENLDPGKLAGKYDTPEELEKGYKELTKKLREVTTTPETYTLDKRVAELGYTPNSDATYYQKIDGRLKEAGITEKQIPILMDIYKTDMEMIGVEIAKRYGPRSDIGVEKSKLEKTWGSTTQTRLDEVAKWARANMPPGVAEAMGETADGVQWTYELMNKGNIVPMRSGPTEPAVSPYELGTKIKELMSSKAYQHPHDPMHADTQAEVDKLLAKQRSLRTPR